MHRLINVLSLINFLPVISFFLACFIPHVIACFLFFAVTYIYMIISVIVIIMIFIFLLKKIKGKKIKFKHIIYSIFIVFFNLIVSTFTYTLFNIMLSI